MALPWGRSVLWLLVCLCGAPALAATVRVNNPTGSVAVRSVMGGENVQVQVIVPSRPRRPDDVRYAEQRGLLVLECRPSDGARIDLEITVPHTANVEAATAKGEISLTGLIRGADLATASGDIRVATTWVLESVLATSLRRPKELTTPKAVWGGVPISFQSQQRDGVWTLSSRISPPPDPALLRWARRSVSGGSQWEYGETGPQGLGLPDLSFGEIRVKADSPGRIELADMPLPRDSWVKVPRLALDEIDAFLEGPRRRAPPGAPAASAEREPAGAIQADRGPLFVSRARMVSLSASAYDRLGRPVSGLKAEDLEVLEDGVPQKLASVGPEESPFNLVLLLDLSASTLAGRSTILEAARRFVEAGWRDDRVAIYALAQSMFQVVSPLTAERRRLLELIEAIPLVSGGTPLYRAIALSYMQESLQSSQQRSAIVILTDGIDASLVRAPGSSVQPRSKEFFLSLRRAVTEMPVLLYPILVPPRKEEAAWAGDARRQMQELAGASGGRLFPAESLDSLEPVYAQLAEELRGVYTVSYYPANQNYDGRWRTVLVRVKGLGVTLRTRNGYYAR